VVTECNELGGATHGELPPPMQRSKQKQRDAGLTANSVRFRRRVRVQGNRPRASRLRASGVRVIQEQRAGDVTDTVILQETTRVCRRCFYSTHA
jgi:hypothetical protein